jgi:hypothetical protein
MSEVIEVVRNPRRRRRRTPPRGRGGRFVSRRSTRRRTRRTYRRRRRNPAMASLAANPRRRRRTYRRSTRRRVYRRRRNPSLFGFGGLQFDLTSAMYVGVGMIGSETIPGLVRRYVWSGLPSAGMWTYISKLGGTFATAFLVKTFTKSTAKAQLAMAGGLSLILVDLYRMYLAPKIGLSGLGYDRPLTVRDVADVYGMGRYVNTRKPAGMAAYVDKSPGMGNLTRRMPVGAY